MGNAGGGLGLRVGMGARLRRGWGRWCNDRMDHSFIHSCMLHRPHS
jgi:hypothetical protein